MRCPHCTVEFHDKIGEIELGQDLNGKWKVISRNCPNCKKNIYHLRNYTHKQNGTVFSEDIISEILIRPKITNRSPVPIEVPKEFATDYTEACLVLADSPKASAALSRRCVQHIIREKLKIKRKDLFQEIQEVIDNGLLPTDLFNKH